MRNQVLMIWSDGNLIWFFDMIVSFFLFIRGSWHLIFKLLENDDRTRWRFRLSARTLISETGFIKKTLVTGTSGTPGRKCQEEMPGNGKNTSFPHSVCRRWAGKESELCAGCFSFTCWLSCHTLAFLVPSPLQTQNTSACIPQGDHL